MQGVLDFANPPLVGLIPGVKEPAFFATHTWAELVDGLLSKRNLPDDWDGQGALATIPEVVDAAISLARQLESKGSVPADFANAGVNASVFFEWHLPTGYLEIEVTDPHTAEGRWLAKGSNSTEAFALSLPS